LEEVVVALVRLGRVAEPGVLPHGPEAAAVHGRLHAAGVRILAGQAQLGIVVDRILGGPVEILERDAGVGGELVFTELGFLFFAHLRSMVRRSGARLRVGPVCACTSSAVTPGAVSRKSNPSGVTSITARSVMIRCTHRLAVSGSE